MGRKHRAQEELPHTNNVVEGWHRKMQSAVTSHHPNIWKFIEVLKQEQGVTNLTLNQIAAGSIAPAPRRKYVTMSRRVCSLVDGYEI